MKDKTLIIASHFNIGETITDSLIELAQMAKRKSADLAVLIGDIAMDRNLVIYLRQGLQGLINEYSNRLNCSHSICMQTQLPKNTNEAIDIIDESDYNFLTNEINKCDPELISSIVNGNESQVELLRLRTLVNESIYMNLVLAKLNKLGLPTEHIMRISEKNLRNVVSLRTRESRNKNWTKYIDKTHILSFNRKPNCTGIMFAFFEKVAELGYNIISFYTDVKYRRAILKSWILFEHAQGYMEYLPTRINQIQFTELIGSKTETKNYMAKKLIEF